MRGRLTVYPPRGVYQLAVEMVEELGAGKLHLEFEALKRELAALGYFDASRKRPLPVHPGRVALVTAASGAAVRDFIRVGRGRGHGCKVGLYDVPVQGEAAPERIAEALLRIGREGPPRSRSSFGRRVHRGPVGLQHPHRGRRRLPLPRARGLRRGPRGGRDHRRSGRRRAGRHPFPRGPDAVARAARVRPAPGRPGDRGQKRRLPPGRGPRRPPGPSGQGAGLGFPEKPAGTGRGGVFEPVRAAWAGRNRFAGTAERPSAACPGAACLLFRAGTEARCGGRISPRGGSGRTAGGRGRVPGRRPGARLERAALRLAGLDPMGPLARGYSLVTLERTGKYLRRAVDAQRATSLRSWCMMAWSGPR